MSQELNALAVSHFETHQNRIYRRTDQMFAWVMAFQYLLAVVIALVLSPRTWAGGASSVNPHVWVAVVLGGILASGPILLAAYQPGKQRTRFVIAIAQGLFSALLIHLTGGRIETHFHVFGSLAFLAMYRDWRVLIVSSTVVALDHVLRGLFFPMTIYGVASGAEFRFVEHAAWVVFEDAFLIFACVHNIREMRGMAQRQAEVEIANARIEEASAEVARGSRLLESVIRGMRDGLVVTDGEGRYLHYNPAAESILGMGSTSIPMDRWPEIYGLADGDGNLYTVDRLPLVRAIRGESVDEDLRVVHVATGKRAWLEVGAEPLRDEDGTPIGGIALFRDVTERRKILNDMAIARDEAERANRAKSEFLSRMSHELRTPMNAILGFSKILRMDDLTEDQEESLDQILVAGDHLLRLINEILDLSGIESGKVSVSREPVDVVTVTRDVMGMVAPLAASANVTLVPPELSAGEAFALADQQRLRQVLLNLISNAIKYNVAGGEVRLEVEQDEDSLRVAVRDTGPGIPPEMRERLFNPFDRLGAETTSVEGTGLGLSLSRRLTEAMGGSLTLREVPKGACFVAEFASTESPLEKAPKPMIAPSPATAMVDTTVLLVEDNAVNVRLVERVMEARNNVQLVTANDGASGLDLARNTLPDLILLDLDLPGMKGLELLRRLRGDRMLDETKIVVVSADASPHTQESALELGADMSLPKPFELEALLDLVDDIAQIGFAEERRVA